MNIEDNSNSAGLDIEFDLFAMDTPAPAEAVAPVAVAEPAPVATAQASTLDDIETPVAATPAAAVQTVEDSVTTQDDSLVSEIMTKLGYDFGDESFDDTPEGILELTRSAAEKLSEETLDNIFTAHPSLKEHFEFLQNGGKSEDYVQMTSEPDFASLNISGNSDIQKQLLTDYFLAKGEDEAFAQDMIESYEDKGTLEQKAEAAKNAFARVQNDRRSELLTKQREVAEAKRQATIETWNTVKATVSKATELSGIAIPEKDRNKFMEYISAPVDKDGRTARDLAASKLTLEQQLTLDYLLFKGMNVGAMVGAKAQTIAANNLRSKLKSTAAPVRGGSPIRGQVLGNGDEIAFDDIFK